MNEDNFKKGIEDVKLVRMTNIESNLVLEKLEDYLVLNPLKKPEKNIKIKSPWYPGVMYFTTTKTGFAFLTVFIVSFISTSSLFLSKNSLPGDVLYPLKVDVMEPIRYTLAVDSISKTNVLLSNLDARLKEVEALETTGRLTDLIQNDLENRLKSNTKKIIETKNNIANIKITKNTPVTVGDSTESLRGSPQTFAMQASEPVVTMAVPSGTSTTSYSQNKENKSERLIRSTKESVERIRNMKKSNRRLVEVAEEFIRQAEDSIRNSKGDNEVKNVD